MKREHGALCVVFGIPPYVSGLDSLAFFYDLVGNTHPLECETRVTILTAWTN